MRKLCRGGAGSGFTDEKRSCILVFCLIKMITEQEKLDKGNSGKQYLERSDEKLGLLELLISAIRDAINAAQNFHPHAFIRLAEKNEFGIHPYSLLYWWSLKETDLQVPIEDK